MLTPNAVYIANNVTVKEKIIPDGTVWKDATKARNAGFSKGDMYKAEMKLNGTGRPVFVTIHNTSDAASASDDAELYVRATYNENMGSARVHFFVDENGAWQEMKAGTAMSPNDPVGGAEVSWHAGDGSSTIGGNMTSLSMEIVMGDTKSANNTKAYDNGARLAAWLLWKNGLTIDKLVTHTYWVNKLAGKSFSDIDDQCTNLILGKKWCPCYIFASTSHTIAKKNWKAFKATVKKYLDDMNNPAPTPVPTPTQELKVGDKVKMANGAPVYGTTKQFASFVYTSVLYVRSINGSRVVVSTLKTGAITGAVDKKYLTVIK